MRWTTGQLLPSPLPHRDTPIAIIGCPSRAQKLKQGVREARISKLRSTRCVSIGSVHRLWQSRDVRQEQNKNRSIQPPCRSPSMFTKDVASGCLRIRRNLVISARVGIQHQDQLSEQESRSRRCKEQLLRVSWLPRTPFTTMVAETMSLHSSRPRLYLL